jgi:hypothetical protein
LVDHPATVNLREDAVVHGLNGWVGRLFRPEHVDETVAALVGAQPAGAVGADATVAGARQRRADADQRLCRFHDAIAAGVDPAAIVDAINQAQTERRVAQAEIDSAPVRAALDRAEVYAMIDSLGDVGATISEAKPPGLARLYEALDVEVRYEPARLSVPHASRRGPG